MAALVRSAAPTATAKRNPRGMLAPAPRPARVVLRRFRPDNAPQKMEKDRSGAQHTGYKHGHDDRESIAERRARARRALPGSPAFRQTHGLPPRSARSAHESSNWLAARFARAAQYRSRIAFARKRSKRPASDLWAARSRQDPLGPCCEKRGWIFEGGPHGCS
eukprot:355827-Chlamydomonas_euryale.AAC.12